LDAYLGNLARVGRTEGTIRKYEQALRQFVTWLGVRPLEHLIEADLDDYFDFWERDFRRRVARAPEPATRKHHFSILHSFFSYLDRKNLLVDKEGKTVRNPIVGLDAPKRVSKPIDWLSDSEDRALLAYQGSPVEMILVWLLRYTGLRVDEARWVLISDLDLTPGRESLRVRVSKTTAGRRTVPLLPELLLPIEQWLTHQRQRGLAGPHHPLLATRNGTPMQPQYIWRVIKRAAFNAGVRRRPCTCGATTRGFHQSGCPRSASGEHLSDVEPHGLRRTFGSAARNRGVQIDAVSKLLGHSSTVVTEKHYAELLDDTVRTSLLHAYGYQTSA